MSETMKASAEEQSCFYSRSHGNQDQEHRLQAGNSSFWKPGWYLYIS